MMPPQGSPSTYCAYRPPPKTALPRPPASFAAASTHRGASPGGSVTGRQYARAREPLLCLLTRWYSFCDNVGFPSATSVKVRCVCWVMRVTPFLREVYDMTRCDERQDGAVVRCER